MEYKFKAKKCVLYFILYSCTKWKSWQFSPLGLGNKLDDLLQFNIVLNILAIILKAIYYSVKYIL